MSKVLLSDRYELGDVIGRGGMADVHTGVDERLRRDVAIKVMRPGSAVPAEMAARFEDEARIAARLNHPNIVSVYDTGVSDDGRPFIVMERLPGETLADRMRAGALAEPAVRAVADDVLAAIGAAHAAGIVHRDIKPGNILFTDDGRAKIADFGIARESDSLLVEPTTTVSVTGTPNYIAPERLTGRPATVRSDIWALGVVLREAMVSAGTSDARLDAVIDRATAPDPDARFSTAAEMAAAMHSDPAATVVDVPLPVDATRTMVAPIVGTAAWWRRSPRRTAAVLGAGAVAAILVVVGVAVSRDGDTPTPVRPASAVVTTSAPIITSTAPTTPPVQNQGPVRTVRRGGGKAKKGARD